MKQFVLLIILVMVLVGCQEVDTEIAAEHLELEGERYEKIRFMLNEQDDENTIDQQDSLVENAEEQDDTSETEDHSHERGSDLTVDEASQVAKEVLNECIHTMEQLQVDHHMDWFQLEEGTEQYDEAVETVKEELNSLITSSVLDKWSELYFKEFFIYHYYLAVLQPADLNILLDVKNMKEDSFTLNFIQLGDVAYKETTEYHLFFEKEDSWKFAGYEMERIESSLNLSFDDLKNAYINVETLERYEGTLVDEFAYEGDAYLVINYGPYDRAINVRTGVDEPDVLNQM
ncbi:hypothetical protein [Alkalibacillus silvisoli]|uniref:Lipoprotein n=1 Tax=Alkalibacillus silvisoli TaxID=392823 RepID=A0ABN0ZNZ5_9BACI